MAVLTRMKNELGVKVRKKIVAPSAYGVRKYGGFYYGAGAEVHGIYRVGTRWNKTEQHKMPFYVPTNRQLPDQQAWRQKFTDAEAGWQVLTDEQKAVYNKKAKYKKYAGHNLYISEHLSSN